MVGKILLLFLLLVAALQFHSIKAEADNVGKMEIELVPTSSSNGNLLTRVKRNEVGHAIKSFGITILALVFASMIFGIDYAVTTIFTPLMIITLTKTVDVKAIIDTCNYRRQQHLSRQNGEQNWMKAIFCRPTEDEAKVHKRRFLLDVMATAFKHTNAKTMQLIQKEYNKYLKLTKYMDESKKAEWNAPKTTRTLLLFFANYGLIKPNENLPEFISEDQFLDETEQATEQAMKELHIADPAFLVEEVEIAKKRHPESAAEIEERMAIFRKNVDGNMSDAEKEVMKEYREKSLNYKIGQKLKWVAETMRKLVRWPNNEKEKKILEEEEGSDKKYHDYMQTLDGMDDKGLNITAKIDKYGLMNYEIVDQNFLEQITRDLAYPHSMVVRTASGREWERKWDALSVVIGHLKNVSGIKVEENQKEEAKLNFESEKELGNEWMRKMRMDMELDNALFLDRAAMENYPKLFQKVLNKVFDEEVNKLKHPNKLNKVEEEGDVISEKELYTELSKMGLHIKKLYIQYGLVRAAVALLKQLFDQDSDWVQKYYLMFLYERKPVKNLFILFRKNVAINLAKELRKEIYQEMERNGEFKGIFEPMEQNEKNTKAHQTFLQKFGLTKTIQKWWVELPPRKAYEKIEGKIVEICKGAAIKNKLYKSPIECAFYQAKPIMEMYERFLWLSNQFRVGRMAMREGEFVGEEKEGVTGYDEGDEQIKKAAIKTENVGEEALKRRPKIIEQTDDDQLRVSRILDEIIIEQKRDFEEMTRENVEVVKKAKNMEMGKNGRGTAVNMNVGQVHVRRRKRFVLTTVMINILRTAGWMQLFKHFNIIEIVRDCIVRSINFQQWTCEYPAAIKAEQNFIHKLKRIVMEEMSCEALPEIRKLYDDFVRKYAIGQKRLSPSELLAESDLVVPYRWEDMLNGYSHEVWEKLREYFLEKCRGESNPIGN